MAATWIQSIDTIPEARRAGWLLRAGCVLAVTAAGILAVYGAGRATWPAWLTLVLFIALLVGGLLAGEWLYSAARQTDQHRRDLKAADLFAAVRTGSRYEPFILYLRPFISTDALAQTRVSPVRVGKTGMVVATDRLEIEGEIEAALRRVAPLVALGEPLEHEGAGRIKVDDSQWQTAIEALMEAASLIIMLPSPRAGTLWEVDRLIDGGYLSKTLILDPPNHGSSRPDYDPEAEWQAVQVAFAERGLLVPDDHREGLVLHFPGGETVPEQYRVGLDAARTLGAIVRRKLAETAA